MSPLRRLLPGVRVRQAQIYDIDLERQVAVIFQGLQRRYTEVPFDHLVVALGQGVDLSRFPGLADHALPMKTLSDAMALRNHVIDKLEHADITSMAEVKRELLTFTVIGGGFSGVETAGEMKDMIERALVFYPNIDPDEVRILVIEFADRLLLELPPSLGEYARAFFEKRGIEVRLGTGVREATGTAIVTSTGEVIGTRTVVATIGNAPTPMVAKLDLPNERGRVRTDRALRVEGRGERLGARRRGADPAGRRARRRASTTRRRPRSSRCARRGGWRRTSGAVLEGRQPEPFVYTSKGALASLGGGRGVAEVFGVRLSGFPAWLLWRGYYLSFVPGFATKVRILVQWMLDLMRRAQHGADRLGDAAGDALRALPRRRPGVRGGQPRRRLLRRGRGRVRADGSATRTGARRYGGSAPAGTSASGCCSARACAPARCGRSRIRWCWWSAPRTSSG